MQRTDGGSSYKKDGNGRSEFLNELHARLENKEGGLVRQRARDGKDVQQVRVIKDRDGNVLTGARSVMGRLL